MKRARKSSISRADLDRLIGLEKDEEVREILEVMRKQGPPWNRKEYFEANGMTEDPGKELPYELEKSLPKPFRWPET